MEPSYVIVTSYHHFHRTRCQNTELCCSTLKIDQLFLVSFLRNLYLHKICYFFSWTSFRYTRNRQIIRCLNGVVPRTHFYIQKTKYTIPATKLMRLFKSIPLPHSPTTGTPVSPQLICPLLSRTMRSAKYV